MFKLTVINKLFRLIPYITQLRNINLLSQPIFDQFP